MSLCLTICSKRETKGIGESIIINMKYLGILSIIASAAMLNIAPRRCITAILEAYDTPNIESNVYCLSVSLYDAVTFAHNMRRWFRDMYKPDG